MGSAQKLQENDSIGAASAENKGRRDAASSLALLGDDVDHRGGDLRGEGAKQP